MIEIFTTEGCGRCNMLKQRMIEKNIDFKENDDEEEMARLGFMTVPMLRTDEGELLDFCKAISWINSL